ncbi:MAG: two pore domain potassium channel family protein [Chlorobaculum sp.]|jgi:voltage-gated potassium channel|nr:two pore domain potassium channel family protein [Chlorobaculum sp.]
MNLITHIKQEYIKDKKSALFFAISPTLLVASYSKSKKKTKDEVRNFIIARNWNYFIIAPFLAIAMWLVTLFHVSQWLVVIGGIYAFSRVNEIFIAFVKDATSHLRKENHLSSLKYYERIPLAMRSYVELIILYGIIVFGLNLFFNAMRCNSDSGICILSVWDAIYYSGVTITTLGYGEITPVSFWTQIMAIYEVINGFSLIVVSFTVYVSRSISSNEFQE